MKTLPVSLPVFILKDQRQILKTAIAALATAILINTVVDYIFTLVRDSSFYLSESLLFSCGFWLLFIPFICIFLFTGSKTKSFKVRILLSIVFLFIHFLTYPIVIWIFSKLFFGHGFYYWQTFSFAISAYFVTAVICYGLLVRIKISSSSKSPGSGNIVLPHKVAYINTILVSDHRSQQIIIETKDVFHFTAQAPYIAVQTESKKYLIANALKNLEQQLDQDSFVRIHKSHIINIHKVVALHSRQNGDYDIQMTNGQTLRLSRHFAQNFKSQWNRLHRLSIK